MISHSWGSMPACRFAGRHPALVDRLVLFGPIARRPPRRYETAPAMTKTATLTRSTPEYAKAVGKRFGQWVLDAARTKYDQAWLDYQYEIGLRHQRSKKNKTDHGHTLGYSRPRSDRVLRLDRRPHEAVSGKEGHPPEVVNRMYDAWWKSMILQATLWAQPYIKDGDF